MEYKTHEGHLDARGLKFAIVVARFNSFITERLLSGALDALRRSGGNQDDVEVVRVPGSWEMPVVARALVETKRFDGIICLGCVVRGETAHFDYVASEAASGLQLAAIETGVPVSFGVLTVDTREQAEERIDRATDAVRTALEMADVFSQLRAQAAGPLR